MHMGIERCRGEGCYTQGEAVQRSSDISPGRSDRQRHLSFRWDEAKTTSMFLFLCVHMYVRYMKQ